ncbi:MAG: endonuclease/exonuclease/phosphatase family protein [Candidatus Rhabdochlamydia sp.]
MTTTISLFCKNAFPINEDRVSSSQDLFKKQMFRLASYLTDPICKCHELFRRLYIIDVLHPTASKTDKWAIKFFISIGMIISSFISIATTIPGICLRGMASHLEKEPFLYYQGALPDKQLKKDFSLLSWNICCVAGGYCISDGGVMPWSFRIDKIITKIREQDADILSLYEVMDLSAGLYLYEKLQEKYAHFYFNIGPRAIGPSSGIFIASKSKISNPKFIPFTKQMLVGRTKMAEKGIFSFTIQTQEKNVKIYATHLQHSEEPQYPAHEEMQARKKEMNLIMEQVHQETGNVIVTGDLNLDDSEYGSSCWSRYFQEPSLESKTWGGDRFCAEMVGKRISGPLNLDYTLMTKKSDLNGRTCIVPTSYDDATFAIDALSDHRALLSRFEIGSK